MAETAEKRQDLKASDMEVCRICMATDLKLHSLQNTYLSSCMETIGAFAKSYEGLPNYVCYQCAPTLIKCHKLIEKSKATESVLYDLFALKGELEKPHIEAYKNSKPDMQSSLDSYLLENYFYIRYDDENKTSDIMKVETDSDGKIKKEEPIEESTEDDNMFVIDSVLDRIIQASKEESDDSESDVEAIEVPVPVVELSDDETMEDNFISLKVDNPLQSVKLAHPDEVPLYRKPKLRKELGMPKKIKPKKKKGLAAMNCGPYDIDDSFVRRYFNIRRKLQSGRLEEFRVEFTPTLQYLHWLNQFSDLTASILLQPCTKRYSCKHCPDKFEYVDQAKDHVILGCQKGPFIPQIGIPGSSSTDLPFYHDINPK